MSEREFYPIFEKDWVFNPSAQTWDLSLTPPLADAIKDAVVLKVGPFASKALVVSDDERTSRQRQRRPLQSAGHISVWLHDSKREARG